MSSPRRIARSMSLQRHEVAEALVDAVELEGTVAAVGHAVVSRSCRQAARSRGEARGRDRVRDAESTLLRLGLRRRSACVHSARILSRFFAAQAKSFFASALLVVGRHVGQRLRRCPAPRRSRSSSRTAPSRPPTTPSRRASCAASSFFVLFMIADRFDVPAQAFLREDEVDRAALRLFAVGAVLERDADRELAVARLQRTACEPECVYCAMFSCRPSMNFQPFGLAHDLQPRGDVEVAGARRRRVRHHDLALVDGLGQVLPGLGLRAGSASPPRPC